MAMRVRRLHDVERDGDRRWFQPALDRIAALRAERDEGLLRFLDFERTLIVSRAPGRLDVMGGIADYSGATVLQLPIDRSTTVIAQTQSERRFDIATRRGGAWTFFSISADALLSDLAEPQALARWFRVRPDEVWAAYAAGCIWYVLHRLTAGRSTPQGLRIVIDSTVPEGKGVSSSAALEVGVMSAIAAVYGVDIAPEQMATACQWVENHIVGAPCGIMDQMTSACGVSDRLLRLKCQPGWIEGHLEIPNGFRFFGIDSGVRHAVTGADYGTVRTAAFMGYRLIADAAGLPASVDGDRVRVEDPHWRGYLANISPAVFEERFRSLLPERVRGSEFLARYSGTTDSVTHVLPERDYPVLRATAHPIYEQHRVSEFADLLAELATHPGLARDLGTLMYESHASYTACGLGSEGTDRLVEMVREAGPDRGLFGAKITGGGSGGTVAVLGDAAAGPVVAEIAARYREETGRESETFTDSGPGAHQTGILILE
jgi:galactokinase